MTLIACSRMYDVAPAARAAWTRLFRWLSAESGVSLEVVEHAAPAPLEALWARDDLGCVFMCGWPFARARPQPALIAAPVPAAARGGGRPVYVTDLVVRRDSPFKSLSDTFGGRVAWTARTSHSGFNALRHHLLAHLGAERRSLFAESVGPLTTPAAALEAVLCGAADVAPLDSFALDLMRLHCAERVREARVIESTAPAPIPPLVASPGTGAVELVRLRRALLRAAAAPVLAETLAALALAGFAAVEASDYAQAERWAAEAMAAGYPEPR